jgi:hypothetical protein
VGIEFLKIFPDKGKTCRGKYKLPYITSVEFLNLIQKHNSTVGVVGHLYTRNQEEAFVKTMMEKHGRRHFSWLSKRLE